MDVKPIVPVEALLFDGVPVEDPTDWATLPPEVGDTGEGDAAVPPDNPPVGATELEARAVAVEGDEGDEAKDVWLEGNDPVVVPEEDESVPVDDVLVVPLDDAPSADDIA